MKGVEVPLPPLPDHLRYDWGPTNAALLIWCSKCKGATVLYSVTILRDPLVVTKAVEDHRHCRPLEGNSGSEAGAPHPDPSLPLP